jgi:AcrR family transcriptional regulator
VDNRTGNPYSLGHCGFSTGRAAAGRADEAETMDDRLEERDRLVKAALGLMAEQGWRELSLAGVATAADLPLDALYRHFPNKSDLLAGIWKMVDMAALAGGPVDLDEPPRDRLFDVMMRRFDAMQEHREGFVALLRELRFDPVGLVLNVPTVELSMRWVLEAAGLPPSGILGELRVRGLLVVYGFAVRAWMQDESADMARTMKELDSRLRQAEQVANTVERGPSLRRGRRDEPPAEPSPDAPETPPGETPGFGG